MAVLTRAYTDLGFDALGDPAFRELVLARIIEPTSKADTVRVLEEIGVPHASLRRMFRSLKRCASAEYRDTLAAACFEHAATSGDLSLCLYDVTMLYFEAEKEDDLRKVGYSKERRVDTQIVVGLLVDRNGFPLEIGCYEGDQAETATIVPMVQQFADRHGLADMVVVADAGMLSAENLTTLDEANLRFIVGSRVVKAPGDLANHFRWRGDAFTDGQVIAPPRASRWAVPPPSPRGGSASRRGPRTTRPSSRSRCGTARTIRCRGGRCGPTPANAPSAITRR